MSRQKYNDKKSKQEKIVIPYVPVEIPHITLTKPIVLPAPITTPRTNPAWFLVPIAIVVVAILLFAVPFGSGIHHDSVFPQGRYNDSAGYHIVGFVDTTSCGTIAEHILGTRGVNFVVSEEVYKAAESRVHIDLEYECKDGRMTNITWSW